MEVQYSIMGKMKLNGFHIVLINYFILHIRFSFSISSEKFPSNIKEIKFSLNKQFQVVWYTVSAWLVFTCSFIYNIARCCPRTHLNKTEKYLIRNSDTNTTLPLLMTWEAHHSSWASPSGCGELPRSLMKQQWPPILVSIPITQCC